MKYQNLQQRERKIEYYQLGHKLSANNAKTTRKQCENYSITFAKTQRTGNIAELREQRLQVCLSISQKKRRGGEKMAR